MQTQFPTLTPTLTSILPPPSSPNECAASVPEIQITLTAAATNTNDADATFAINSDINELVDDGKMHEFMQYIEHIDNTTATNDKLDFKEFEEESKRIRYPSYNAGGGDGDADEEIDEFTFIVADDEDADDADEGVDDDNDNANKTDESERSKRNESKRKTNMFANDTSRFIDYERINEAKQLHSTLTSASSASNLQQPSEQKARDSMVKSKTVDQFLSAANFEPDTAIDADAEPPKVDRIRVDSDVSIIESPSTEALTRRESLTSDVSGESSYFNFKRSSDSESAGASAYTREDSWLSYDSNVLFDRSQSTFSELEYIHGREDWKDRPVKHSISSEIDSDDYHHDRRFSENSDTLEYIRGREDWLKKEMDAMRGSTLPRIFEHADRKFLIQDEIDSDEYHHNFYVQEAERTAVEMGPRFLVHGSARSGRARSPYRVLHAEIGKNEFLQRYYWQGADDDERGLESMPVEKGDVSEENMIRNERLIWIQNERSCSQSPMPIDVRAVKVTKSESPPKSIPISGQRLGSESDAEYDEEIRSDEINEVIDNIIDAKILTEDSLEKSPNEDIEIMVLDLADKKPHRSKNIAEPLIVISEATDDEKKEPNEGEEDDEGEEEENEEEREEQHEDAESLAHEIVDDVDDLESFEIVNVPEEITVDQPIVNNNNESSEENRQIETEPQTSLAQHQTRTDKKLQQPEKKKTKKNEKYDDLIQEGSMGPWFHK